MVESRACRRPCWNSLPAGKDEFASITLIEGIGTSTSTSIVLCAPTPAPAFAPAAAPSLDNKLLKQFMKAYLKVQVLNWTKVDSESCKQSLTARFLDLYYDNLHMDYYQFCQQCKDHSGTAGAKKPNRIPFSALFLHGSVTPQWFQHKQRCDEVVPMTWIEFKDFLQKNLGDSRAFVDSI